jgi:hypothetical protein
VLGITGDGLPSIDAIIIRLMAVGRTIGSTSIQGSVDLRAVLRQIACVNGRTGAQDECQHHAGPSIHE